MVQLKSKVTIKEGKLSNNSVRGRSDVTAKNTQKAHLQLLCQAAQPLSFCMLGRRLHKTVLKIVLLQITADTVHVVQGMHCRGLGLFLYAVSHTQRALYHLSLQRASLDASLYYSISQAMQTSQTRESYPSRSFLGSL